MSNDLTLLAAVICGVMAAVAFWHARRQYKYSQQLVGRGRIHAQQDAFWAVAAGILLACVAIWLYPVLINVLALLLFVAVCTAAIYGALWYKPRLDQRAAEAEEACANGQTLDPT